MSTVNAQLRVLVDEPRQAAWDSTAGMLQAFHTVQDRHNEEIELGANYNQIFNDAQYIQKELGDRDRQFTRANSKLTSQVANLRYEVAAEQYQTGWYAFLSGVLLIVLFAVASAALVLSLITTRRMQSGSGYALLGVLLVLDALVLIVYAMRNASRRKSDRGRFYWNPVKPIN